MWTDHLEMNKHAANKVLHQMAIPLHPIAAGELDLSPSDLTTPPARP